jgi:O-antigen ligase
MAGYIALLIVCAGFLWVLIKPSYGVLFLIFSKFSLDLFWESNVTSLGGFDLNAVRIVGIVMPLVCVVAMFMGRRSVLDLTYVPLMLLFSAHNLLLAFFKSNYPTYDSIAVLLRLVNGFAFYIVASTLLATRQKSEYLINAWILSSIIPVGVSLFLFATHSSAGFMAASAGKVERLKGLYHDAHGLAMVLILVFPLLALRFQGAASRFKRGVFGCLMLVYSWLLIFTQSRTFWIIGIIQMFVIAHTEVRKRGFIIVAAGILFAFVAHSALVMGRFDKELQVDEWARRNPELMGGRVGIWEDRWANFTSAEPFDQLFGLGNGAAGAVHNDYLRILIDNGLFGSVVYFVTLVFAGKKLISIYRSEHTGLRKDLSLVGLLTLVNILVMSVSLWPSLYPNVQWFFWGFVGVVVNGFTEPGSGIPTVKHSFGPGMATTSFSKTE